MRNYLFTLLLPILLLTDLHADEYSSQIVEKCNKWRAESCKDSCKEGERGKFIECYMDPEYAGKMTWRDCYALHIGYSCKPCKDTFSTNFGGSFKSISCEYFYNAIEKKNKRCKNCLQVISHLNIDPADIG